MDRCVESYACTVLYFPIDETYPIYFQKHFVWSRRNHFAVVLCHPGQRWRYDDNPTDRRTARQRNRKFKYSRVLTQKYSALKPGIRVCDAPTWCKYSKNVSKSSKLRIPSSNVSITLLACSPNSSDDACCSLVFNSLNLLNKPNSSPCSSNSLQ